MKKKQKKKFIEIDAYLQQIQQDKTSNILGQDQQERELEGKIEDDNTIGQPNTNLTKITSELKKETVDNHYPSNYKRKGKGKNNHHMYELNHLAKFQNYDDDPFIEDPKPKPQFIPQSHFYLRPTKNPKKFEYESQFNIGQDIKGNNTSNTTQANSNTDDQYSNSKETVNMNCLQNSNEMSVNYTNILDQHLIQSYISILNETFPNLNRKDIAEKICEYNFDIDKVVLYYFNDSTLTNTEYSQYENMIISNIESLSSSFFKEFKHNDNITPDQISKNNAQTHIQTEIKKKQVLDQVNTSNYNERDYPFITEEVKQKYYDSLHVSSEYFLDKHKQEIKTNEIRTDLIKLCKAFPFEDEFVIKWVYYQFMDYTDSIKFLEKKHINYFSKLKKILLENSTSEIALVNNTNDEFNKSNDDKEYNSNCKGITLETKVNKYKKGNEMKIMEILCEKPINWNLNLNQNDTQNININEYKSIRSQLINQANIAWRAGRGKDAKAIMAKARRYKVIIDEMIQRKKVKTFTKNNQQYSIGIMYSKSELTIDLHGLSYDEAIIILKHKLFDEEADVNINGNYNRKLVIITGKGNNSVNNKPVLFPKISKWLKERQGIQSKPDFNKGIITIHY